MAKERNDTDTNIETQHLEPQPVVSIRATIPVADLSEAVGDRISALSDFLRQHDIQPAGPPFARYHTFGETETDFEFGVPVAEPVAGEGSITAGALPGGPAIATWHIGPHDRLGEAYARVGAWLQEHNREPNGASWEAYYWLDLSQDRGEPSVPDSTDWRTRLIQPIK